MHELLLCHIPSKKKVSLAKLDAPSAYRGEWRCDVHPRFNRQGNRLCVDSAHGGHGRQMNLVKLAPRAVPARLRSKLGLRGEISRYP
jgi:hypothetical protein